MWNIMICVGLALRRSHNMREKLLVETPLFLWGSMNSARSNQPQTAVESLYEGLVFGEQNFENYRANVSILVEMIIIFQLGGCFLGVEYILSRGFQLSKSF